MATALRISKITVQVWVQRFKTKGLDGLKESPGIGAKRKLTAGQKATFKDAVMGLLEQRTGGRISGHDNQALLEEQFQLAFCFNTVYNLLDRLDIV